MLTPTDIPWSSVEEALRERVTANCVLSDWPVRQTLDRFHFCNQIIGNRLRMFFYLLL